MELENTSKDHALGEPTELDRQQSVCQESGQQNLGSICEMDGSRQPLGNESAKRRIPMLWAVNCFNICSISDAYTSIATEESTDSLPDDQER